MAPVGETKGDYSARTAHEKLLGLQRIIIRDRSKVNLLLDLRERGLCTRDIMSFVENQRNLRVIDKTWDASTARQAMTTKIRDAKNVMKLREEQRNNIRKECIDQLGGKKYKLRRIYKGIKRELSNKVCEHENKNGAKMNHLEK